jgi:phosphatidylglycerophosphatase A
VTRILDHLAVLLGTAFFSGYFPVASGTVGTLVAVPLYLLAARWAWPWYAVLVLAVTVAGIWAAHRCERLFGEKDSSRVVIDEVAGFLVTMAFVTPTWTRVAAGFFLFRFFDVIKPPPAGWADLHLRGGLGVMLDDLVAGFYAWLVLQSAVRIFQ